ncbi:MAG: hypothetical protein J6T56_02275, partial [Bacteroidales bacterium]|nr:hypothetical protein [Bacteroidales bacterium]
MKKLLTRSITGALFVAVMVLCILWNYVLLFNLLLVITCIALFEYRDILWQNGIHLPMVLFYTVCLAVFFMLSVVYMILPYYLTVLIICCLLLLFP